MIRQILLRQDRDRDSRAIQPLAHFGANGLGGANVVSIAEVALSLDVGHVKRDLPARDRRMSQEPATQEFVVSFQLENDIVLKII